MRVALPLMLLCLAATSAGAQTNPCAAITDNPARLKCYDDAAAKPKSAPAGDPVLIKARAAATRGLKDPESARFEGIVKRPGAVCGFVNAKNAMGGYAGRRMFVYVPKDDRAWILEVGTPDTTRGLELAETHCQGVPGF